MLYIVATPIGNLDEITLRALDVLKNVDLIAAEDTRHTALLLGKYGVTTRMTAYHKFNEKKSVDGLIELLKSGKDIAVVSDAGMPTVSDPGHIIIDAAIAEGVPFTVVSGACAAINALVLSGLDTRSFAVLGFLPEKSADRRRYVEQYRDVPATLVVYSAVHDINKDLEFLHGVLGKRRVAVCREMTKMFETVTRGTLGDALDIVEKGEFVIVIEGAKQSDQWLDMTVEEHLNSYTQLGVDMADAVKRVASERHVPKSEVYKIAVEIKNKSRQ